MAETYDETHAALAAMPSLREAARLVGVLAPTLSRFLTRRPDLSVERVGRERRLTPETLIAAARHYRKRPTSAVAFDAIELAHERAPEAIDEIESRIDRALYESEDTSRDDYSWLADAERVLPPELFAKVKVAALGQESDRTADPAPVAAEADEPVIYSAS